MQRAAKCGEFFNKFVEDIASKKYKNPLCRTWKAQNQIFCFIFFTSMFITLLLFLVNYLFLVKIVYDLRQVSSSLFEKETQSQITKFSQMQNDFITMFFIDGTYQLQKINDMYQQVQKGINIEQPYDCLLNQYSQDQYSIGNVICYAFCDSSNPNKQKYINILNLTSLLTEYLRVFNFQRYTYYTQKDEEQFFALFNGNIDNTYLPHSRPWYTDHIKHMSEGTSIIVSDPYLAVLGTIYIAQTSNLTLLDGTFDGVIAQDGDFSNIPKFNQESIKPIIVNQQGEVVISDLYNNNIEDIIRIDNETLTGFTKEQWNEIKQVTQITKPTILDLYNSKQYKNILVSTIRQQFPTYYVLLLFDDTNYKEDEQYLFQKIIDFHITYVEFMLVLLFGLFLVIAICQSCFIKWLDADLQYITLMAKYKMCSTSFSFKHKMRISKKNTAISHLFASFVNLNDNFSILRKEKSYICKIIEQLSYPSKFMINQKLQLNLDLINNNSHTYSQDWMINNLNSVYQKYIEE